MAMCPSDSATSDVRVPFSFHSQPLYYLYQAASHGVVQHHYSIKVC